MRVTRRDLLKLGALSGGLALPLRVLRIPLARIRRAEGVASPPVAPFRVPLPISTHLHGSRTSPASDGDPMDLVWPVGSRDGTASMPMDMTMPAPGVMAPVRVKEAPDATPARSAPIRTPDQRVRVFVSSTLEELATERAAKGAIAALGLTPVLFDLGARPHPPRDLYRAYLARSDIFVGIYGQRYGWVAPDMAISGLDDEYRLVGDKPRLIYVKAPALDWEPRLVALLARIRDDGAASYKMFATPDELRCLIADDLAVLLSERFAGATGSTRRPAAHLLHTAATLPPGSALRVGATALILSVAAVVTMLGLLLVAYLVADVGRVLLAPLLLLPLGLLILALLVVALWRRQRARGSARR